MKQVNFEKLELKSLSGRTETADVREFVGEMIYARMGGLRNKLLAEKIFKSTGACELEDADVDALRSIAESGVFSAKLSDAILNTLGEGGVQ